MLKTYLFMTGAHQYRLQAYSREEAYAVALRELCPDDDARAVILHTLREEGSERWLDPRNWSGTEDGG